MFHVKQKSSLLLYIKGVHAYDTRRKREASGLS